MADWACVTIAFILIAGSTTAAYFDLRKWMLKSEMQREKFDHHIKHGCECTPETDEDT